MDRFLEEIVVKKNKTGNEILFYLSMVVMVLSGILALFLLNVLFMNFSIPALIETLVFAGVAVVLFLFRDRLRTEYEYTFTNGDLDFAMVFNNSKRKSLCSLKVRNVEAFGPVTGNAFNRYARHSQGQLVPQPGQQPVLFLFPEGKQQAHHCAGAQRGNGELH